MNSPSTSVDANRDLQRFFYRYAGSKGKGDIDMRSHLQTQVNRKVSHFILGEEGKVGSQSAFAAAAFIGATSLAGMLLGAPNADADGNCGNVTQCGGGDPWCCGCWDAVQNQGYENCVQGDYWCAGQPPNTPGISCWQP